MEDDPLLEHVSRHLGETLVGASLLLSKMQKLREAAGQDTLEAKELKRRETGMILEMAELRKSDQETKKLLFEKSQETLRIHARNTNLRAEVDGLKETLGNRDEEVVQLKEKSAKLKEELVRKDELFQQTNDELTGDAVGAYAVGFEDATAQVACVHPIMDLSQTDFTKVIADGKLLDDKYRW